MNLGPDSNKELILNKSFYDLYNFFGHFDLLILKTVSDSTYQT